MKIGTILSGCVAALSLALIALVPESRGGSTPAGSATEKHRAAAQPRSAEEIAIGDTFEWQAGKAPLEVRRRVGPMTIRIIKKEEDEFIGPAFEVRAGDQAATFPGEMGMAYSVHSLTTFNNGGGSPVLLIQGNTGGAHCCVHPFLVGIFGGELKVIDLGLWDGDDLPVPKDISGDGIADIVMRDDSFLYAFSGYAQSWAPPMVLNLVNGEAVDVSERPEFAVLYLNTMTKAGVYCRRGQEGADANGACPAFVASAARIGKLDEAWGQMLQAYDPKLEWTRPPICRLVGFAAGCPPEERVDAASYPDALLAFLKERGYIALDWQAPVQSAEAAPRG